MNTPMSVAIIGAGIGGLATACALQRAGFEAHVYEAAPELREVGAGISLWANATAVLRQLGLLEQALQKSSTLAGLQVRNQHGKLLSSSSVERYSTPTLCLQRSDLVHLLANQCQPSTLHLGQTLKHFEQTEQGVTAFFDSGKTVQSHVLLGADGIRSKVRAQLKGDTKPVYRGYVVWRGTVHLPDLKMPTVATEYWGAGKRFGLLPMHLGHFYWYATNNQPENKILVAEQRKTLLQELFKDWCEPITSVIGKTSAEAILHNDCYDRPPEKQWSQGRVCLLGDAAHSTTPNMGQGGCLALEDAAVLTKLLQQASNPQVALQMFEHERYTRAKRINQRSLFFGQVGQWQHPWLVASRNLITKSIPQRVLEQSFREVYAYQAGT